MTIDRWIVDAAARWPDRPALVFGGETLGYAAFADRIADRTADLAAAGVARGDRVAWYGLNHPEVFVLLFACARAGAMLVPLNWRLAEAEVAAIVDNCAPRLVFHDAAFAGAARRLGPRAVAAGDRIGAGTEAAGAGKGEDPILLVYTSGSTGRPKGAVLTQDALAANAAMSVDCHGLTPGDAVLNVLPLFHVGGLNILPTPAFSIGATVHLHERFDAAAAVGALQRVQCAIVVPTVLQAMLAAPGWAGADLRGLRALSIGSTDVPVDLIQAVRARGVPVLQIYGATETAPFAIYQRPDDAEVVGSIGRAGCGCDIRLVTADGAEADVGEPGEILVRGRNVMREYWRDPVQTAGALRDGWFRTGDVARRDAQGRYWFADRIKHVIISGGENIYPAEIERALRGHPAIREVAVVGRPDPKWGAIPVAVAAARGALTLEDLRGWLDGRLARYKLPRALYLVDALPRNAMGKVVAAEVRALAGRMAAPEGARGNP